mgnify:CR=1 FL=1
MFSTVSGIFLSALVLLWQDSPVEVARLRGPAEWIVRGLFLAALPGFLWGARSIPAFDPLGTRPIRSRLPDEAIGTGAFVVRGPYRWIRHPQYFFTLILIWAQPDLTADRLLFDLIFSAWIVIGTVLEERDLVEEFGELYRDYQKNVPMLLPYRRPSARI